jgi:ankyrin repeat protein
MVISFTLHSSLTVAALLGGGCQLARDVAGHPLGPHRCHGDEATHADAVSVLIEPGAHVNATDRRVAILDASAGWTPLHMALRHEQFTIAARLLRHGANPAIRSAQGITTPGDGGQ